MSRTIADTPVILLHGARQTGKITFLTSMQQDSDSQMVSLDDLVTLQAIQANAQAYLAGLPDTRVILDEAQRAPELFLPLKEALDRDRKPSRFWLTRSANVLTLPKLADSLAGRMEVLTLWPLSQGEIRQVKEGFIDLLF